MNTASWLSCNCVLFGMRALACTNICMRLYWRRSRFVFLYTAFDSFCDRFFTVRQSACSLFSVSWGCDGSVALDMPGGRTYATGLRSLFSSTLTALISSSPVSVPADVFRFFLYCRHSPRIRSRAPKRSTIGCSKPVRNMRMKRMLVKSLMVPTLS